MFIFSMFKNIWLAVLITPPVSTYLSRHTTLTSPLSLHFHKPSEYRNLFQKSSMSIRDKNKPFHIHQQLLKHFPGEGFVDTKEIK